MIRVTVFYPGGAEAKFDHQYYTKQHRALVHKHCDRFGLERIDMERGVSDTAGGSPTYLAIGQLTFKTLEGFQQAWAAHGAEITADIPRYTNTQPVVQISEVL